MLYNAAFLSTLSLRRATCITEGSICLDSISIHALLAESDGIGLVFLWWGVRISIHALLAESDNVQPSQLAFCIHFYPRSPCGERLAGRPGFCVQVHFYPRSPCGERRAAHFGNGARSHISIHALLAESDCSHVGAWLYKNISIHALLAESDRCPKRYARVMSISIHALLAESDSKSAQNSGALLRI